MMKSTIVLILSLYCFFSCEEKKRYHIEKNVLALESPHSTRIVKQFINQGEIYYYTSDLRTLNQVFIYDRNGKSSDTLDFNDFISKNGCNLKSVCILNFDTIIAFADNNLFFLIDRNINTLKSFNYFKNYIDGEYLNANLCIKHSFLYTSVSPMYNKNKFNHWKEENRFINSAPVISKINLNNNEISFYGKNIKRRIFKDDEINFSFVRYFLTNDDNFIYFNPFSDTLYEISKNNQITPIRKVESKLGEVKLPKVHYLDFEKKSREYMPNYYEIYPHLDWLVEDTFRDLWYLVINDKKKFKVNTPFSVVVYNKKWEKLDEIVFDETKYNCVKCKLFLGEKGLYIERVNNDRKSKKRIFDCLVYESQ